MAIIRTWAYCAERCATRGLSSLSGWPQRCPWRLARWPSLAELKAGGRPQRSARAQITVGTFTRRLDLQQLEPHLGEGGLIFADDCNDHTGKGAKSAAAMFQAYATYVSRSRASLASLLRVESCVALGDSAGFCVAAKGALPNAARSWLRRFGVRDARRAPVV